MRPINYFVVTRTTEDFPAVQKNSFDRGMIYPAPHMYIYKMSEEDTSYSMSRMRPMAERCGTIRDSALNGAGYGILVKADSKDMDPALRQAVAIVIKSVADDLGLENYQIVSDEVNEDKFLVTFEIPALIAKIPSVFTKRK